MMDDVLQSCFDESLDSLGINYARYTILPYHIRKTSLSFDIYNIVSDIIHNPKIQRIDFSTKNIYDFSEDELDAHYKILSASFALSCLGYQSYIKQLLYYLDFPECRWTIKIDYLLKLLLKQKQNNLSIPLLKKRLFFQRLFIKTYFYSNDLTSHITQELLKRKNSNFTYFDYINSFSVGKSTFISALLDVGKIKPHAIDEVKCSEFFYINSYNKLNTYNYDLFVSWLDESVDRNNLHYIHTITETIKDVFTDLAINKSPKFWIKTLKDQSVNPLTTIFIFKIIDNQTHSKKLASKFINELISSELDLESVNTLSEVYQCKYQTSTILKMCNFFNKSENLSEISKIKVSEIMPMFQLCINKYVSNLYLSELESLILICQDKKKGKSALLKTFLDRFKKNSESLYALRELEKSTFEKRDKIFIDAGLLLNSREKFDKEFLIRSDLTSNDIINHYKNLFKNWSKGIAKIEKRK